MSNVLALAIAHLKVGLLSGKSTIGIYPNKIVYKILEKLQKHKLIQGWGIYRNKGFIVHSKNLSFNKINQEQKAKTTKLKRFFLISIYFRFDAYKKNVLHDIFIISKPGHRVYFKYYDILF